MWHSERFTSPLWACGMCCAWSIASIHVSWQILTIVWDWWLKYLWLHRSEWLMMHNNSHLITSICLVIYTALSVAQVSRGPYLSTFRTENLKINAPPRRFSSIIDEAVWLMRTHFLKRQMLSRKEWESLPRKFAAYSDVNEVSCGSTLPVWIRACTHLPVYDENLRM